MGSACEQTGLTPDVIRAWERRYDAVTPQRTAGNQRAFSDLDIYRLRLLRQATRVGRSISKIAHLSNEELVDLVAQDQARLRNRPQPKQHPTQKSRTSILLQRCLEAVQRLDGGAFERQLELAVIHLGWARTMDEVLVPLMEQIDELWSEGAMSLEHERLASALVRSFVGSMTRAYPPESNAPGLIIATPRGQVHELGAALMAATAAAEGWRVTYLGAEASTEEIAMAVLETEFEVVALSLAHPEGESSLDGELKTLRRLIGDKCQLVIGGQAVASFSQVLDDVGALRVEQLPKLRQLLVSLRSGTDEVDAAEFHPFVTSGPRTSLLRQVLISPRASIS
ncbi:MAG: MerR family transcriptional regulator [Acidobacteriota bacterium]|nr:MerR family transcriptional regulator [Acidobacteriota bacterium]